MKSGIFAVSALALLLLAGCTLQPQTTSARELLFSAIPDGQHLVWDYPSDYQIDAQQASALKAVAKGDPLVLAAKIAQKVAAVDTKPTPTPAVVSCRQPNLLVFTSNALTQKYADQGCIVVSQVNSL
jgi:hypothetical protein